MAWTKPTTITSWSASRYKAYQQCPLKLKLSAIDKIKEPQSAPMKRGDDIHKEAEAYVRGTGRTVPKSLAHFKDFFKGARKRYTADRDSIIMIEDTWAFRKDWTLTTWNDWTGCWLRVKMDYAYIDGDFVYPVDYKTGKFSPHYNLEDYVEQLDLYATATLVLYPEKIVVPRLFYLDHNIVYPAPGDEKHYTKADLPALKKSWEKKVKPMLTDQKFAPKPNQFCYSCFFRKDNKAGGGGQCQY